MTILLGEVHRPHSTEALAVLEAEVIAAAEMAVVEPANFFGSTMVFGRTKSP